MTIKNLFAMRNIISPAKRYKIIRQINIETSIWLNKARSKQVKRKFTDDPPKEIQTLNNIKRTLTTLP